MRHGQVAKTLVSGSFFCAGEFELYLLETQSVRAVVLVGQFCHPSFETAVEIIKG